MVVVVEIYLQIDNIFVMTYLIAGCVDFYFSYLYLYLVTGVSEGRSLSAFTFKVYLKFFKHTREHYKTVSLSFNQYLP